MRLGYLWMCLFATNPFYNKKQVQRDVLDPVVSAIITGFRARAGDQETTLLDPPSAYRTVWVLGQNHRGVHR